MAGTSPAMTAEVEVQKFFCYTKYLIDYRRIICYKLSNRGFATPPE
jgi:hypothetical protein